MTLYLINSPNKKVRPVTFLSMMVVFVKFLQPLIALHPLSLPRFAKQFACISLSGFVLMTQGFHLDFL